MLKLFLVLSFITLGNSAPARSINVKGYALTVRKSNDGKPTVVLIITKWCKYCHAMKNTMLRNTKVQQLLKEKFRTLIVDAEQKNDIQFAGRTFKYSGGLNQLARELGTSNGRISYPTLCILNSKNEIVFQYAGYLSPIRVEAVLLAIGG